MQTKYKVILSVSVILTAFALGRYTLPEKVKTVIQTVTVEKKTETKASDTDRNKHKVTTTTTLTKPDGTKSTTTTVTEDTNTDRKTNVSDTDILNKQTTQTKEITYSTSKVTISALAGAQVSFNGTGPVVYGGSITKPILGPITVGVWGLSSGVGGASLGLTF